VSTFAFGPSNRHRSPRCGRALGTEGRDLAGERRARLLLEGDVHVQHEVVAGDRWCRGELTDDIPGRVDDISLLGRRTLQRVFVLRLESELPNVTARGVAVFTKLS
jgi:hypothetical protein